MVGIGFDVHQLGIGESLILGGVKIDSTFGTIAHSDGDVLLHAAVRARIQLWMVHDPGRADRRLCFLRH